MKAEMRQTISRVSLLAYMVLLVLSGLLTSAAGGRVAWLCVMGLLAVLAMVAGPRKYRILGIVALLAAMVMASMDYYVGKKSMAQVRRLMEETQKKAVDGNER
jgi:hypothetical protein